MQCYNKNTVLSVLHYAVRPRRYPPPASPHSLSSSPSPPAFAIVVTLVVLMLSHFANGSCANLALVYARPWACASDADAYKATIARS